ncbi:hypothetical protein [Saccharothrix violaceirubra]|uniref:Uncharacterized protein n=1 Tax=Saccharothrix violaceirubra TaxID=413306 RepID=A0A7W7T4T5_9PSEU|nr:hypothetical protein [Saccharothrix violaceirubra]MBB4966579.1 hypothetical protein [Saccharothrix violaceirubra]
MTLDPVLAAAVPRWGDPDPESRHPPSSTSRWAEVRIGTRERGIPGDLP